MLWCALMPGRARVSRLLLFVLCIVYSVVVVSIRFLSVVSLFRFFLARVWQKPFGVLCDSVLLLMSL